MMKNFARPMLALLILAVLGAVACQPLQDDTVRVRFVPAKDAADLRAKCPTLIGHSTGCTKREKDGSVTIVAIPPKNVEDEKAMIPIGHEFFCHAWLNQSHSGVDPSNDCRAPS